MVYIEYFGINPESIEFVHSSEFRAVLTAHPNLRLVKIDEDEDGGELIVDAVLPLQEGYYDYVGVIDTEKDNDCMWILYGENCEMVEDPSPTFIEILKLMDAFSIKTLKSRIFLPENGEHYRYSPELLTAEFDFTTGGYKL